MARLIRRLRTETYSLATEGVVLYVLGLRPRQDPYVPHGARAYYVLGFVLHQVYAPRDSIDPRTYEVPRKWRIVWVGANGKYLP